MMVEVLGNILYMLNDLDMNQDHILKTKYIDANTYVLVLVWCCVSYDYFMVSHCDIYFY